MITVAIIVTGGATLLGFAVLGYAFLEAQGIESVPLRNFIAQLKDHQTELLVSTGNLYHDTLETVTNLIHQQVDLHTVVSIEESALDTTISRLNEMPAILDQAVDVTVHAVTDSQSQLRDMMRELSVLKEVFFSTQAENQQLLQIKDDKIDDLFQKNQDLIDIVSRMQQRITELMSAYNRSQSLNQSQHEEILHLREIIAGGALALNNTSFSEQDRGNTQQLRFL